ncbi:MAG: GNAT family N-acetyltransferase [Myxococcota bacterium]
MSKKKLNVVGAVICNDAGQILCALRGSEMSSPNVWEFPGGKREPGETPEQALRREIREELGCSIEVYTQIEQTVHEDNATRLHLSTYYARILEGTPTPVEHAALRWVARDDLDGLAWAPADEPTVRHVMELKQQRVDLRTADLQDLECVRRWDEQPHVLASDPDDDWAWETELPRTVAWREQLVAEVQGIPIGFVQIIDPALEESHYWGDVEDGLRAIDIWIGEYWALGQGLGTQIMNLSLQRCFASPEVRAVLVDPLISNTRAHRFYERFGFTKIERRWFEQSDCFVYRLEREAWHPLKCKRV